MKKMNDMRGLPAMSRQCDWRFGYDSDRIANKLPKRRLFSPHKRHHVTHWLCAWDKLS